MMSNIDSTSAMLGLFGILLAIVAIVVTFEVSRRFNSAMAQQKEGFELYINQRLNQQEIDLKEALSGFKAIIANFQTTTESGASDLKSLGQELNTRISMQDDKFDDTLRAFRESVAKVEKTNQQQTAQITELRNAVAAVTGQPK